MFFFAHFVVLDGGGGEKEEEKEVVKSKRQSDGQFRASVDRQPRHRIIFCLLQIANSDKKEGAGLGEMGGGEERGSLWNVV
jgi:hypothetical protein